MNLLHMDEEFAKEGLEIECAMECLLHLLFQNVLQCICQDQRQYIQVRT